MNDYMAQIEIIGKCQPATLIEQIYHVARSFYRQPGNTLIAERLSNLQDQAVRKLKLTWDEVEAIEIHAYQTAEEKLN